MVPKYVVGVDGGTESIRAGVFDLEGHPLSFSAAPYATTFPHPSWAEQNPADWWQGLGVAVKQAVAAAGISPADVAAVCVDTTCCTVVALDEQGDALRPALLWMDMRSAAQAARVAACSDPALQVNGGGKGPVSAEWMIPKALWLKDNEPELFAHATHICEYQDFFNFHLTGRMCASVNNASVRWHYSTERGWPTGLLRALGLDELLHKWPQEVLPLGAVVGGLTSSAAAHLGLAEGTPVAQGGADAFIGMLGLGVLEAGQMALLTGSSHLHLGLTDRTFHGAGIWGTYPDALLPGLSVVEGGQTSTGSVLAWFSRLIDPQGAGSPGVEYAVLDTEAAEVPAGSEGVRALDHFQGNRTPHTDPASRGAIVGLTLKHGRGHVFRALLESICFGTEQIFETMASHGYSPTSVAVAGGATRSDLWMGIHADVSNVPFVLTRVSDAPALGCAILASVAAGLYPDVRTAAARMVHVDRVVQPDSAKYQQYRAFYDSYKGLYPSLKQPSGRAPAAASEAPAGSMPRAPPTPLRAIVSPSILSADFANLARDVNRVADAGAEWIHVDVFDGNFVPNLTIGPPVVKSLRKSTNAFLDCHLCVLHPETYVKDMASAGADQFTFHIEAVGMSIEKASQLAAEVRAAGMMAGIALAPETPAESVFALAAARAVDTVLLLSVRPGFGGQKFMPEVLPKVAALRERFPDIHIEVDGGITADNAAVVAAAGANALVAGTTVFAGSKPPEVIIPELLSMMTDALRSQGVIPA